MNRRALIVGGVSAILLNLAAATPNVILCMADDLGWGDTGYNGHPHLKTPHLDAMSREGVTFTRFYSAAAMCSPTRGSCYTGRNPYRFGVTYAMKGRLEDSEVPITTPLKKKGYTTGHFGKWHLGTLSKKVGDQARWGAFSKDPVRYYCPPWERDVDVSFVTESKVPTWNPMVDQSSGNAYGNDYFTGAGQVASDHLEGDDSRVIMDRVIPFVRKAAGEGQPFFAAVWFHTPHSPVVAGPRYREIYRDLDENRQHYYGCITAMDEQVGRLRAELEKLGVAENTMFWFCSDNGPARQGSPRHVGSTNGLSGYKLSVSEGGIRVPGLLVWPGGVDTPRTVAAPCVTSDYFPTILEATGAELPAGRVYDGISLLPLVRGERKERGSPIGLLNKEGKESVWMGDRYKLVVKGANKSLFNIPEDPGETRNLAGELPDVSGRMEAELSAWKAGVMGELAAVPE